MSTHGTDVLVSNPVAAETVLGAPEGKLVAEKASGVPYEAPDLQPRVITDEEWYALASYGMSPAETETILDAVDGALATMEAS